MSSPVTTAPDAAPSHLKPDPTTYDNVQRVLAFTVVNEAYHPHDCYPWDTVHGAARPDSEWSVAPDGGSPSETPSAAPATTPR